MLKLGLLESDLVQTIQENSESLNDLRGKNILILGGTGFVGSWLSKTITYFINEGGTCDLTIAARNTSLHKESYSELPLMPRFMDVDILSLSGLNISDYDLVINCATPTTSTGGSSNAAQLYRTLTEGSLSMVKSFTNRDVPTRLVNLSSGAVSSLSKTEPTPDLFACPKEHISLPGGAYSHGKREAEKIILNATHEGLISGINLRLYAFAGPGIALDQHFAAGNFMLNAKQNSTIYIKGNPNTVRSYQYPTDLMRSILLAATGTSTETVEVGSEETVTMLELAKKISQLTKNLKVSSGYESEPISKYYPMEKPFCDSKVTLDEAIQRWWTWIKLTS